MKIYTAEKDSWYVELVRFFGFNVTWRATKVVIWLSVTKRRREFGLGYVDLVRTKRGNMVSTETRRCYGPIAIRFKGVKK